ncbi:hypothetical protein mRhiFer1_008777 [Rhinolophus ferrumequinum]|uniref:Uncharacterized protein n=1 Tax=Rhinolophus ferrumequinum TaxID=59479 RepID=A0A7J7TMA4_RHIFE|nr:hypothetical protein mRhiFer1_008777 [Rhinolophus ferrumequinum]
MRSWGPGGGRCGCRVLPVEDTAALAKAGSAGSQPCGSYPACSGVPLKWSRSALSLLSSIHCLAFQSSVEKGVCNGQQPNSQGAHPSAVGSWAARMQPHPSRNGPHVANSAASRCGVMSTVAPAEKPRGAQAIRLAEGVGGRTAVGLGPALPPGNSINRISRIGWEEIRP